MYCINELYECIDIDILEDNKDFTRFLVVESNSTVLLVSTIILNSQSSIHHVLEAIVCLSIANCY